MEQRVTQLHNVSPEDFKNEILEGVQDKLEALKNTLLSKKKSEYLNRKEVSSLLGVSLVTINHWCNKKILKPYRIGNSIRFKREEIEETLNKSSRE